VREDVRAACEILGFDPRYVANEGRFVALVAAAGRAKAPATSWQRGPSATRSIRRCPPDLRAR